MGNRCLTYRGSKAALECDFGYIALDTAKDREIRQKRVYAVSALHDRQMATL